MRPDINIPALLASILLVAPAQAQVSRVTATVDKKVVERHDTLQLQIAFEGVERAPSMRPLRLDNFDVISGPHSQQSVQIVNGRMSRTLTYVYTLRPKALGTFTIPAFSIRVGLKKHTTQPLRIQVIKGSAGGQMSVEEAAFVELVSSKTDAYVYEQLELTLKVFVFKDFQVSDLAGNIVAPKEFLEEDLQERGGQRQTQTTRSGRIYRVQEIPVKVLFPVVTGKLTIPETTITGALLVPQSRRQRRRSPFDDFFGGGRKRYRLDMKSPPMVIDVKPLPEEGRPPEFNEVIGAYGFHAKVAPTKVRVGDGITLTMVVNGQGYIKAVQEPKLESEEGFKLYRSEMAQKTTFERGIFGGIKTFKKIIEPQSADITEVPAVAFSFFDPRSGQYKTIRRGPFPIEVTPSEVEKPIAYRPIIIDEDSKQEVRILTEDILPIMTTYSSFSNQAVRLHRNPVVLGLVAVPPFVLLLSLLAQRKRIRLITDTSYARQRGALGAGRQRLGAVKRLLKDGEPTEVYAALSHALTSFIADKLDRPAASVSPLSVPDLLSQAGVPEDTVAETKAMLETCDEARFSAGGKSSEELRAEYDRVAQLIQRLGKKL